jgi:hypothetical protein
MLACGRERLDLQEEPPATYTVQGLLTMLRAYGPLGVAACLGTSEGRPEHVRVVTGMHGDGTPDGTHVWHIDPADGRRHQETFEHFVQGLGHVARSGDRLRLQVVHNRV